MSTALWPACASRLRRVRGSPLEVILTDMTRIETSNALPPSNSTKLDSNPELQEASHGIVAASIPAGIIRSNDELLPAIAAKLGVAV